MDSETFHSLAENPVLFWWYIRKYAFGRFFKTIIYKKYLVSSPEDLWLYASVFLYSHTCV